MKSAVDIYVDAVTRRNDVLGEGIVDLVRATARLTARLYRAVQTEVRKRAWIRRLDRLNDHLLRDIGLSRGEIADFVTQHMADQAVPSDGPSLVQRAGQVVRAAQRAFKIWRDARVTARQLRDLDRRMLADIGVQPGDIDGFARDVAERSFDTPTAANDNRIRSAA